MYINNRNINIGDYAYVKGYWHKIARLHPDLQVLGFSLQEDGSHPYTSAKFSDVTGWKAANFRHYWTVDTDWITEYVYDNELDTYEFYLESYPYCHSVGLRAIEQESGWFDELGYMDGELQEVEFQNENCCVWCGNPGAQTYCDKTCFALHGQSNEIFWILAKEATERVISIDELIKFINNL